MEIKFRLCSILTEVNFRGGLQIKLLITNYIFIYIKRLTLTEIQFKWMLKYRLLWPHTHRDHCVFRLVHFCI